jgi:hypothetical protein
LLPRKKNDCSAVAGTYAYDPAGAVAVFKSGGTATHSFGPQGKWTCVDGTVTVTWNIGYTDRLTPLADRPGFSAVNNIGTHFSAKRM